MDRRAQSTAWGLWNPKQGIVFAAGQKPLYPRLDMSRFFHTAEPGPSRDAESGVDLVFSKSSAPAPDREGISAPLADQEAVPRSSCTKLVRQDDLQKALEVKEQEEQDSEENGSDDPPVTSFEFKIPEEAFRAARLAAPGTPESFWSYALYRGPGEDGPESAKVKVHYCKSMHTTERVCQYFMNEKIVGFDLEWAPDATKAQGARRNVSLMQLASPSRIALFHLALFPKNDELVAPSFKKLMENPEITKIGVFIKGDSTRLENFLGIRSRGLFELSHLYKLVKHSSSKEYRLINKKLVALAKQVQEHLRLPMFKGLDIRAGDWSKPLDMNQIIYSASDAYAAIQLFDIMDTLRQNLDPSPPRPYAAELNLPIRLADGVTINTDEETEPTEDKNTARVSAALPKDFLSSVSQDVQIERDEDYSEPVLKKPPTPKPRRAAPATPRPCPRPKDDRVVAAEAWVSKYRASRPKTRAAPSAMRAYHIWFSNEALAPEAIAGILRDPPLQTNTVVSYIMEAIRLEKLPFGPERLRDEVLALLPKEVVMRRYRAFMKSGESSGTQ